MLTDRQVRDQVCKRLAGLKNERTSWEPTVKDISTYTQQRKSRFLCSDVNKGDRTNPKLLNSRGIVASRTLTAGMTSGLSSPSRPWFKIEAEDDDLNEFHSVRIYCDTVQRRISNLLAASNFYAAAKSGYGEQGLFGTEACVMIADWEFGPVFYPLTFGEYWIANNRALQVDTLYRRCDMTVGQVVERFVRRRDGSADWSRVSLRVRNAWDGSRYDEWIEIYHAIEPNYYAEFGKMDRANKAWRSIYWEAGNDSAALLERSGFDEKPFWAARWDRTGSDVYGASPGMDALADLRTLQLKELRLAQAIEFMNRPPLKGPPALQRQRASLVPGGITFMAPADDAAFKPIWQVQQDIANLRADLEAKEFNVDQAFYADLFNAITNMRGIQPRNAEEIASRNEEKLTQLGPVVENATNEKLVPAIQWAHNYLERLGQLPDLPEELDGQPLKITMISILAQMQRAVGVGAIERAASFVGNLAGVKPDIIDKFDFDQAVDEYGSLIGVPAVLVRSDEVVAQERQARAQAAQQERQAALAAQSMPAAKQGADAARLLSETDRGDGASLLSGILGNA